MSIANWLWDRLHMPARGRLVFAHDLVMAAASFLIAMVLRVGFDVLQYYPPALLIPATVTFTLIAGGAFLFTGLYRGVWRYASLADLVAVARAATITVLLFLMVMFLWTRLEALPRSVPFINWLVLMALLGGPRFLYRSIKDRRMVRRQGAAEGRRVPVLIAGAGHEAALFIQALRQDKSGVYAPLGIVAEKQKRVGQEIQGVPVLGTLDDVPAVVAGLRARGLKPERIIVTPPDLDSVRLRSLFDAAANAGMTLSRLPRLTELSKHRSEASGTSIEVRPIAVEDLLGRPQTPLDRAAMWGLVHGRRVLISGAGGSIGSELVRQVAAAQPGALVLLEQSEFNLYTIEQEVSAAHPTLTCVPVLADVRDPDRIGTVFAHHRPELVLHAAALKHVPLVELNPFEAVRTNVFGTVHVADAAATHGALAMVMISTDKAINPSSVMGATKRVAERYCQALDLEAETATRFVTVRFGNVLGSTGSVVPLFQRQLAAGGPLTVTHPDMKRYFMTVGEAVELILQAAAIGVKRGGDGRIFVLDMGAPVRILDLAKQMILLAGLRPHDDVEIAFTGLRPGEKLFEELFGDSENLIETDIPGIRLAAPEAADRIELRHQLEALGTLCRREDHAELVRALGRLVPEFRQTAESASADLRYTASN